MDSLAPLDVIAAHPWKRALFTTFSLGASFTEAVIVEALLRRGVDQITILADEIGIKMALREQGAVRIGREYTLQPVTVVNGCFHPKIAVLLSDDRAHILVGSGNLTFGGWSSNLECIDHLHGNGCSGALFAIADFLDDLATSPKCSHFPQDACTSFAEDLRVHAAAGTDDGSARVIHSLEQSISSQLIGAAAELGGAIRLTVAAPFWSSGTVDELAKGLGLAEYHAHVAGATVRGPHGTDWPRDSRIVKPVRVGQLSDAELIVGSNQVRELHAKLFEIVCNNGRFVLSGSPNATAAALDKDHKTAIQNIEVAVLRIESDPKRQWLLGPATPPKPPAAPLNEDGDDDKGFNLLSAKLSAGVLSGRILGSWSGDSATGILTQGHSSVDLGDVLIASSVFEIELGEEADAVSLGGRMVLRLQSNNGQVAEGFVIEPGFAGLRKRAGKALQSVLAALRQLHTPEDVLAILEFFRENPDALRTPDPFSSGGRPTGKEPIDPIVSADQIRTSRPAPEQAANENATTAPDELDWRRLMQRLVSAMAEARPRTETDDDDDDDREERKRRERRAYAIDKLNIRFPGMFGDLSSKVQDEVTFLNLARLTHFVCVATSHPMTREFTERLVRVASQIPLTHAGQQTAAWLVLCSALADTDALASPTARSRLLAMGLNPDDDLDPHYSLLGLSEIMAPGVDPVTILERIRSTRTVYEDVRLLEHALEAGEPIPDLPALMQSEHWPGIAARLGRTPERRQIWFVDQPVRACPCCQIEMLRHLRSELERRGVCHSGHSYILVRDSQWR